MAYNLVLGADCSSSFVVPSKVEPARDGPAYLLTAGHCAMPIGDDVEANQIVLAKDLDPAITQVSFRHFADSPDGTVHVKAKQIAFATMKGADLAIVELLPTRHELRALGVVPFVLADQPPSPGDEIAWAGHSMLLPARTSAGRLTARVDLMLESKWHWYDVEALDCLGIEDGASGSPIFARDSGHVIAVENTVAEPLRGFAACELDHPCEVTAAGIRFAEGTPYAMPVDGLGGCFDDDGRFNHGLSTCPLDRGIQMQPTSGAPISIQAQPGAALPVTIDLRPSALSHYRHRIVPVGSDDCRDTTGYGPVVAWADAPAITTTLPGDPGQHLICIQAGTGADPTGPGWQEPDQPTVAVLNVYADRGAP